MVLQTTSISREKIQKSKDFKKNNSCLKCVLSRFCLLRKSTELSISSKNSLQLTDFKDNKSQNVNYSYLPKD